MSSVRLWWGWLVYTSLVSSLWICLVDMIDSWLVILCMVVIIFGVILKLSWVENCVVWSMCNGLLLKEFCGVFGVWISLVVRLCRLL